MRSDADLKIVFSEPWGTLSWTAYHLFSKWYNDQWRFGKISLKDQIALIDVALNHCLEMLSQRSFWQFKYKRNDRKRIQKLLFYQSNVEQYLIDYKEHIKVYANDER